MEASQKSFLLICLGKEDEADDDDDSRARSQMQEAFGRLEEFLDAAGAFGSSEVTAQHIRSLTVAGAGRFICIFS